MRDFSFDFLREQIVGIDSAFDTPFGRRLMVYCDYTASGRCLIFIEQYLQSLQRIYDVVSLIRHAHHKTMHALQTTRSHATHFFPATFLQRFAFLTTEP